METVFVSKHPEIDLLHLNDWYSKFLSVTKNITFGNWDIKETISTFFTLCEDFLTNVKNKVLIPKYCEANKCSNAMIGIFSFIVYTVETYGNLYTNLLNELFNNIMELMEIYNKVVHANFTIKNGFSQSNIIQPVFNFVILDSYFNYMNNKEFNYDGILKKPNPQFRTLNFKFEFIIPFIKLAIENQDELNKYRIFLISQAIEVKNKGEFPNLILDDLEHFFKLQAELLEGRILRKNLKSNLKNITCLRQFIVDETYQIFSKNGMSNSKANYKSIFDLTKSKKNTQLTFIYGSSNETSFLLYLLVKNRILNSKLSIHAPTKNSNKPLEKELSKFCQNLNTRHMQGKDYKNLSYEDYSFLEKRIMNIKEIVENVYIYRNMMENNI